MNQSPDLISERLRAVEREVDTYHLNNPLTRLPFTQAAWYFLAFCEEMIVREIVRAESSGNAPSARFYSTVADNVIVHAKWPLKWLFDACSPGDVIPRTYDEGAYEAAWKLSEMACEYLSFESAFTYASLGLITLSLHGQTISASPELRTNTRFDAYDHLTQPAGIVEVGASGGAFLERLSSSVRVDGEWFAYDLSPWLVKAGVEALSPLVDPKFILPGSWQFPRFTLDEFARIGRVLYVLAVIHFHARISAAMQGCANLGYSRALIIMERAELLRRLLRYTGVAESALGAIIEAMTYGARGVRHPDPALQPLIPLSASTYAIAPNIMINSSLERNLTVLLNRLPDERSAYATLSRQREALSRDAAISALSTLGWRCWYGKVTGWDAASEIDLAIVSDAERCCLILELKSFIAPAEPREIRDRSEEIRRGIRQIQERKSMATRLPDPLLHALRIDDCYRMSWAVASDTSVGAAYVQDADVPVVRTSHLLTKLAREQTLGRCCDWLKAGDYLPIEGMHYEVVDFERTIGRWTVRWYGIKPLVENYV